MRSLSLLAAPLLAWTACNAILGNADGVYVPALLDASIDAPLVEDATVVSDASPEAGPVTPPDAAADHTGAGEAGDGGCATNADCEEGTLCDWDAQCGNRCATQGSPCNVRTDCCAGYGCFPGEGDSGACFGCFLATSLCTTPEQCCSGMCTGGVCL